jgi:hypothetical protein
MERPWWRMDEERNDWGFLLRFIAVSAGVAHLGHVAATQHIGLRETLVFHERRVRRRRRRREGTG